jgi:hypothetical protein
MFTRENEAIARVIMARCRVRADRAEGALRVYSAIEGMEDMDADRRTNVVDFLTDLKHYCDAQHIDFRAACEMADVNHVAELQGES